MCENKPLQLALLISILLHFTVFLSAPYTGVLPKKQPFEPIKVAYLKPEEVIEKKTVKKLVGQKPWTSPYRQAGSPVIAPEALPQIKKEDITDPPLSEPLPLAKRGQVRKEEPTVETVGSSGRAVIGGKGKKFEAVVNDEKDNIKRASYISYYRSVRERIRYYADRNYIKEGTVSEGEVFVSFTVTSRGELLHIMIMDNRSAKDRILRNTAVNSIRDASPFPAFPQGMNQYQITFNVIISFELNR
ncbi:MAG: TonB family protein [Candidatus Omnitrophota bacterium]|jgi:protein TonB